MKKQKRHVHRNARRTKSRVSLSTRTFYGIEHEFILITGGGFLVIILGALVFFAR